MKTMTALALALPIAVLGTACTRDVRAMDGEQIEQQYGVPGAHSDTITTQDGQVKGTLVPITMANGRQGQLFIPQKQANGPHPVYLRDEQGMHPVQLQDNASREEIAVATIWLTQQAVPFIRYYDMLSKQPLDLCIDQTFIERLAFDLGRMSVAALTARTA